jgi:DNA-binding NarL/FixJ family response regulator
MGSESPTLGHDAHAARTFRRSPRSSSFRLQLTARETEVLQLLADGLMNKQIAQLLYLSPETIKSCVDGIRMKLDASNRTHAVSIGFRDGLID